jgi:hypothetical protein
MHVNAEVLVLELVVEQGANLSAVDLHGTECVGPFVFGITYKRAFQTNSSESDLAAVRCVVGIWTAFGRTTSCGS